MDSIGQEFGSEGIPVSMPPGAWSAASPTGPLACSQAATVDWNAMCWPAPTEQQVLLAALRPDQATSGNMHQPDAVRFAATLASRKAAFGGTVSRLAAASLAAQASAPYP